MLPAYSKVVPGWYRSTDNIEVPRLTRRTRLRHVSYNIRISFNNASAEQCIYLYAFICSNLQLILRDTDSVNRSILKGMHKFSTRPLSRDTLPPFITR